MTSLEQELRALEKKFPDDGNGDEDAYNKGWNDCRERVLSLLSSRQDVNKWRVSQGPYVYVDFDKFDDAVAYWDSLESEGWNRSKVTPHPGNKDLRTYPEQPR